MKRFLKFKSSAIIVGFAAAAAGLYAREFGQPYARIVAVCFSIAAMALIVAAALHIMDPKTIEHRK